jgi:hypothetical protein
MGFDESRDQTPKIEKKKFFCANKVLGSPETTNIEQYFLQEHKYIL